MKKTNGETEITAPWATVFAQASIDGKPSYNEQAKVEAIVSGGSIPIDRGVAISSTIDQSFRKATSQPLSAPDLAPIPGSNPPVWKEPVPLGEAVHSAAYWDNSEGFWKGHATFFSDDTGFSDPTFKWTKSGGNALSGDFDVDPGPDATSAVFSLGTSKGGPTTKSTTISLDVTDSSGTETNDYTVNWHSSVELGDHVGLRGFATGTTGPLSIKTSATTTTNALNPGQAGTFTQDLIQITVKAGAEAEEFIYSIASNIAGAIPVISAPIQALLDAASISMGQVPDPQPEDVDNGGGEWANAVTTQQAINTGTEGMERINPPSLADDPNSLLDTTDTSNPWQRCVMELYLKTDIRNDVYKLDNYNLRGYEGETEGSVPNIVRHKIFKFKIRGIG